MRWYFSRALTTVGVLAALVRIAVAVILGDAGAELLPAVGTAVAFVVGGMLAGVAVDLSVEIRRRARRRRPERTGLPPRR